MKNFELSDAGKADELCKMMVKPELEFSAQIFNAQWPEWDHFYG